MRFETVYTTALNKRAAATSQQLVDVIMDPLAKAIDPDSVTTKDRLINDIIDRGGNAKTVENYGDNMAALIRNSGGIPVLNAILNSLSRGKLNKNTDKASNSAVDTYNQYLKYLDWRKNRAANNIKQDSWLDKLKFWK